MIHETKWGAAISTLALSAKEIENDPTMEMQAMQLRAAEQFLRQDNNTIHVEVHQNEGFSLLRDPNVVWYGPHPCDTCGRSVVKTGNGAPLLTLDAEDHNHHYPNFRWIKHQCNKPH